MENHSQRSLLFSLSLALVFTLSAMQPARAQCPANAGSDQNLCDPNPGSTFLITLAGNDPGLGNTGLWTIVSGPGGGSFTDPTQHDTTFSAPINTQWVLRWTITQSDETVCSDDVNLNLFAGPLVANAGPDQTGSINGVCGTSTTITANEVDNGTGTWTIVAGDGNGYFGNTPGTLSSTNFSETFNGTAGQTYTLRWSATNGVCSDETDDVDIEFFETVTANAGADQNVCGTNTSLAAVPSAGSGSWSILSGAGGSIDSPSSATSNFSGTAGTTYTLQWTETNGSCSESDTVSITFFDNPTPANAGPDQDVCDSSVTLAANAAAGFQESGSWSVVAGAGGSFGDASSPTSTFTGTRGVTYTLRWTISNGVCPISSDDVQITLREEVTANAGSDQNVCGTNTFLGASLSTGDGGSWSILSGAGGTIDTPSSPTSGFSGVVGTTYTLQWTETNGPCDGSDTVTITLFDNPTAAAAGADQDVCDSSVTLAANAAAGFQESGSWSVVAGAGGSFGDATSPTSTFTGTRGVTYTLRWTISNGVCPISSDDVQITLREEVTANAGADQDVCGTSTTLAATLSTGDGGSWSIISGAGGSLDTPSSPTSGFNGTVGTTYTLQWTETNGDCDGSDTVEITLFDNPTAAAAGADQDVCDSSVTLAANAAAGFQETGSWSEVAGDGNGSFGDINSETSTFTGTRGVTYTLRWTISNGVCPISSDDVQIQLREEVTANAGADQNVCGTSTTLAATLSTGDGGSWSILSGAGGSLDTPSSPTSGFNGTVGTTYTLQWTETNGDCDGSDTVEITLFDNPTASAAGPDQALCGVEATLAANAAAGFQETGTWSVVAGDGNGSFSDVNSETATFTGSLATTYTLRWTISNGVCPISTDDVQIEFFDGPTPADAGTDIIVCSNPDTKAPINTFIAVLAGNTVAPGETGTWSVESSDPGGAGFTFIDGANNPNTRFEGDEGATYTLRWTIDPSGGPCPASTDDTIVAFLQAPPEATATDQTVCADTVTLDGSDPGSNDAEWTIVAGDGNGYFSGTPGTLTSSNPTDSFNGTRGTSYTLRYTIASGNLCNDSSVDVTITLEDDPTPANAGPDQTGAGGACGTTATLAGNTPTVGTGTWSITGVADGMGVLTDPSDPTTTFSGTPGQTYTLTWTISNGTCSDSTDTVDIEFQELDTADAGPDQVDADANCGGIATLAGNTPTNPGSGGWSIIVGDGNGSFNDDNLTNATFTGTAGFTYTLRWTILNGDCPDSHDDVIIEMRPDVEANAGSDQNACDDGPTTLGAMLTTGTGGMWTITNDDGFGMISDPMDPNSEFSGTAGYTYTLEWEETDIAGCSGTDTVDITFVTTPTPDAGADDATCADQSINLDAAAPIAGTGMWSVIDGPFGAMVTFGDDTSPTSSFSADTPGIYTLQWEETNGTCVRADTVIIEVQEFSITVPPSQALGLDPIQLEAEVFCPDGGVTFQWENLTAATSFPLNENPITLDPAPTVTSTYQVTVTDGVVRDTLVGTVTVLVPENTVFTDFNNDGCNDEQDLLDLIELWATPFADDADGDGIITVIDLMYIHVGSPCP